MLPRNYSRVYLGAFTWRLLPECTPPVFYRVLCEDLSGENHNRKGFLVPFFVAENCYF